MGTDAFPSNERSSFVQSLGGHYNVSLQMEVVLSIPQLCDYIFDVTRRSCQAGGRSLPGAAHSRVLSQAMKMQILRQDSRLLGHIVRPSKLMAAEKSLASVLCASSSCHCFEKLSFLSACNVYRRFISNFERVAAPMNDLM